MKHTRVFCLSLGLAGTLLLAQPGRFPQSDHASGLPVAQQERPGPHADFSETQGASCPTCTGKRRRTGNLGRSLPALSPEAQAQTGPEQVLYAFGANAQAPAGNVIFDSSGNLYGTTLGGGTGQAICAQGNYTGCGTVFELSPNGSGGWTETVLYNFRGGSDGWQPTGGLIFDEKGNLYGTTSSGGSAGSGTVFELSSNGGGGWAETILYSFGASSGDGREPLAGLIFDQAGNLYGTTSSGGSTGGGTVFQLSPNGSGAWTETVLYNFQSSTSGETPEAGLIFDQAGNLYGTTFHGGNNACGCGAVFELSPNGSGGWTETTLYTFGGHSNNDGANPAAGVIFDQFGDLYGTTVSGGIGGFFPDGQFNAGTIFELSPNGSGGWRETVLYTFPFIDGVPNAGGVPSSGLIFGQSGDLYGTTSEGGGTQPCLYGCGVVYELVNEPATTFSATSLQFGDQTPGVSSSPQIVTLTNSGRLPLNIDSIQLTGTNSSDFAQTNKCPASLVPHNNCNISVTFTPTEGGNRAASLQVADNASGSPQAVSLAGTGKDFAVSLTSQASITVTPGQAANYAFAVAPLNGFAQKVTLSCSGAPAQSTCTISPSSVNLNGTANASANVSVVTSGGSASLMYPFGFRSGSSMAAIWLAFSWLPGLVLLGNGLCKGHSPAPLGLRLLCALGMLMIWCACGGGSSTESTGGATPAGTYTLTVTGTFSSGPANLAHSAQITLVVQ